MGRKLRQSSFRRYPLGGGTVFRVACTSARLIHCIAMKTGTRYSSIVKCCCPGRLGLGAEMVKTAHKLFLCHVFVLQLVYSNAQIIPVPCFCSAACVLKWAFTCMMCLPIVANSAVDKTLHLCEAALRWHTNMTLTRLAGDLDLGACPRPDGRREVLGAHIPVWHLGVSRHRHQPLVTREVRIVHSQRFFRLFSDPSFRTFSKFFCPVLVIPSFVCFYAAHFALNIIMSRILPYFFAKNWKRCTVIECHKVQTDTGV